MKAVIFSQYGTPADLQFTEVERSAPRDNEVLVEVHATTVNRTDYATCFESCYNRLSLKFCILSAP